MNIVGQVINGYLFEEALGSGSFGAVYRVSKENNVYAAKVLSLSARVTTSMPFILFFTIRLVNFETNNFDLSL